MSKRIVLLFVVAALGYAGDAGAQAPAPTPAPPPYGAPINLADAKKAADAAVAEVAKVGSAPDAIAIVDHGGFLIYFERMDNTQLGSVEIAIEKARTAALFRGPARCSRTRSPAAATPSSRCVGPCRSKAASP